MIPKAIKKIFGQTIKYDDLDKITLQCRNKINDTTNIPTAFEEMRSDLAMAALNCIESDEPYIIKLHSEHHEGLFIADDVLVCTLEIKPVPRTEIEEVTE